MGRIGLAGAPSSPDVVYAIIEASADEKGVYRSTDFGESWEKRSDHMTTSPQYYNEIIVDPKTPTGCTPWIRSPRCPKTAARPGAGWGSTSATSTITRCGSTRTIPTTCTSAATAASTKAGTAARPGAMCAICRSRSFTAFSRTTTAPFYNVCGGTQDNNSLCAPSRTTVVHGITNTDWTHGAGRRRLQAADRSQRPQHHLCAVPVRRPCTLRPAHPGARVHHTASEKRREAYKWNWNTPLLLSPHSRTRLYYGAREAVPLRRSRRFLARDQPRPYPQDRSQQARK